MISPYRKFYVAILILIANVLRSKFDIDFGMTPELATALINGIGAYFIYRVPNSAPDDGHDPHEEARGV